MARTLVLALVWWIAVALEVGTLGHTPGMARVTEHGFVWTGPGAVVHLVLLVLISAAVATAQRRRAVPLDLQGSRGKPGAAWGFAATVTAVGLLLDATLTVPLFVHDFAAYFGKWTLWTGYALSFAVLAMPPRPAAAPPVQA